MGLINASTFNPEIVYAFDCWNEAGTQSQPHSHDYTEISIILEGSAHYYFDNQDLLLPANSILIFNPGVSHYEIQAAGSQSHQLHIGIRNFAFAGYAKDTFPNRQVLMTLTHQPNRVMDLVWRLVEEIHQERSDYRVMTKVLVMELMVNLVRQLADHQSLSGHTLSERDSRKQTLVAEAMTYIDSHFDLDLTLDSIAQELMISPTYLSKIFKEVQDTTVIAYLIDVRMKEAANRLKATQAPVKTIAVEVGYQDPLYFSKQFKRSLGQSPRDFRRFGCE